MSVSCTTFWLIMEAQTMEEEYYTSFRDELLAKSKRLLALTKHSKVKGDYHEVLIREFIRKQISSKYRVGHGLVYDERNNKVSRECDVIVYEKGHTPLFELRDLVIANPDIAKFVMEVKSTLTSSELDKAIQNLHSVKQLNHQIMCSVIGFQTNVPLYMLYLKAWKSKAVQFLLVLKPKKGKQKNDEFFKAQTKWFVKNLRHYGGQKFGLFGYSDHLILRWDEDPKNCIILECNDTEDNVRKHLSKIFSEDTQSASQAKRLNLRVS